MRLFKIAFDNPGESYFAGQVVIGKVLVHLNRPKKIKALKLRCIGRAEVNWTERKEKTSNHYNAKEPYFNFEVILTGEDTSHDIVLPIGENAFPFQIQLPGGIPSSFQGTHGNVQYFLKATLTRPWKFSQKVSSYFTVNGFVDLNVFGTAAHPLTVSKQDEIDSVFEPLGCFCCSTSLVRFTLTLDKTGFVPGDNVRFSIQVQNESSIGISVIILTLIQIATFKARGHEKYEAKVVNELRGPSVAAREREIWDSDATESFFKIPAVPPTNLGGGSIITLQYYLSVTLKFCTLFERNVDGRVQIVIGTVPYRNFFEQLMPSLIYTQPLQPVAAALPETSQRPVLVEPVSVGPTSVTMDFTLPPPSYAEAMELYNRFGSTLPSPSAPFVEESREDISLSGEDDEAGFGRPFTPRYATYEWNRLNRNS